MNADNVHFDSGAPTTTTYLLITVPDEKESLDPTYHCFFKVGSEVKVAVEGPMVKGKHGYTQFNFDEDGAPVSAEGWTKFEDFEPPTSKGVIKAPHLVPYLLKMNMDVELRFKNKKVGVAFGGFSFDADGTLKGGDGNSVAAMFDVYTKPEVMSMTQMVMIGSVFVAIGSVTTFVVAPWALPFVAVLI